MNGQDRFPTSLDDLYEMRLNTPYRSPRTPVLPKSMDDLLSNRFGAPHKRLLRSPDSLEDMLDSYYGHTPKRHRKHKNKKQTATAQSLGYDDGSKVIPQHTRGHGSSLSLPTDPPAAAQNSPPGTTVPSPPAAPAPQPTGLQPAPAQPVPSQPTQPAQAQPTQAQQSAPTQPAPTPSAAPAPSPESDDTTASEDDFLQDLKDIVLGKKTYDDKSKQVVDKGTSTPQPANGKIPAPPANGLGPALQGSDSKEIFDRIAQSMQYAGAYDLGTVELENRFADFDRAASLQDDYGSDARDNANQTMEDARAGAGDFLQDLDSIRQQAADVAAATGAPRAAQDQISERMSVPSGYSRPFYDTGEHVMAGEDLYRDQLLVGKPPGVLFSYGEIVSMADLFESVDKMNDADAGVLQNIKTLIDRSLAFYKGKKKNKSLDVSNGEWDDATNGEYLRLAEVNFDHFAPNILFTDPSIAGPANPHTNHKEAWEEYHKRAIAEAQKMGLDPANAKRSYIPVWPLIINAFGDHFLTDAFSAGHLINKAAVAAMFRTKFFDGSDLNSAGKTFFENVATLAWKDKKVSDGFSKLETVDPQVNLYITKVYHADINSADRLGKLLKQAAEQETDRVANLVVKAIHDLLNKEGVDVVNDYTKKPWHLTGDGYLTDETLGIMRQAVAQSVANITDPSILASNIDFAKYLGRVWSYVPRFAPGVDAKVIARINGYVDPASPELVKDAAAIIVGQVDETIKLLKKKHILRPNTLLGQIKDLAEEKKEQSK